MSELSTCLPYEAVSGEATGKSCITPSVRTFAAVLEGTCDIYRCRKFSGPCDRHISGVTSSSITVRANDCMTYAGEDIAGLILRKGDSHLLHCGAEYRESDLHRHRGHLP